MNLDHPRPVMHDATRKLLDVLAAVVPDLAEEGHLYELNVGDPNGAPIDEALAEWVNAGCPDRPRLRITDEARFRVDIHNCIHNLREDLVDALGQLDEDSRPFHLAGSAYQVHHFAHHYAQARTAWNCGDSRVVASFFDLYVAPEVPIHQSFVDPFPLEADDG